MLDESSESLPQKAQGSVVSRAVFHALAYADVFEYPLTKEEVFRYLPEITASFEEVAEALAIHSLFAQVGDHFVLAGREEIVETRKRRVQVAERLWPKAFFYGRMIARLPFVRMVAVTGSLAMNNAEAGKDIDYMIVTAPKHLWMCRALALFIARLARLQGINLCPNYLVTTNALALHERSLYVAHELVQMIPLSGMNVYAEMRRLNRWADDYLPNAGPAPAMPITQAPLQNGSLVQRVSEVLLRLSFANWFESWEMGRKVARLSQEQSASFESYFSADICKGHMDRHGQKTEHAIQEKLKQISLKV